MIVMRAPTPRDDGGRRKSSVGMRRVSCRGYLSESPGKAVIFKGYSSRNTAVRPKGVEGLSERLGRSSPSVKTPVVVAVVGGGGVMELQGKIVSIQKNVVTPPVET